MWCILDPIFENPNPNILDPPIEHKRWRNKVVWWWMMMMMILLFGYTKYHTFAKSSSLLSFILILGLSTLPLFPQSVIQSLLPLLASLSIVWRWFQTFNFFKYFFQSILFHENINQHMQRKLGFQFAYINTITILLLLLLLLASIAI